MPWPTPQDYNEAIQNPKQSFNDAELMAGAPELTSLGLPRPITGNFASVYRLHCGRRDWAVRCFWREYADMAERYEAIARHLDVCKVPYTVGFEYLPQGIRVRGQWYPILKMEWVEGDLLSEFIQQHLADPAALRALAERWTQMMQVLEDASIAHGDLQHGNVLVVNGQLKLVDYDGMYVPALAGRTSHELGHQNYQHPKRSAADFGPYLDRFSAWIIYISLVAVSHRPELWTQANAGDECLLLRKDDFDVPSESTVLTALKQASDEQVRHVGACVPAYLCVTPRQVPPVFNVNVLPAGTGNEFRRRLSALVRRGSGPPVTAFPTANAVAAPAWLEDVTWPATGRPLVFGSLPTLPRACLAISFPVLAASMVAAVVSVHALIAASATMSLVILSCNVVLFLAFFARDPLVVEKRALMKRRRYHLHRLRSIQRSDSSIATSKTAVRGAHDRKIIALAERKSKLELREGEDRDAAQTFFQSKLAIFEARLERLDCAERDALATSLKVERERHMQTALKQRSLWSAHISGLDAVAKTQLWLMGVRTAHDVGSTHVDALKRLGRERAASLLMWRLRIESETRDSLPRRLPAAQRESTSAPFMERRERLRRRRASMEDRHRNILDALSQYYGRASSRIDAKLVSATEQYRDECGRLESAQREIHKDEPVHSWQLDRIGRELTRYQSINLRRYIVALVRGRSGSLSWSRERTG